MSKELQVEKMTDVVKFRAPESLRARLKAIAKFKHTKYQHEARMGLMKFADEEERAMKEEKGSKRK